MIFVSEGPSLRAQPEFREVKRANFPAGEVFPVLPEGLHVSRDYVVRAHLKNSDDIMDMMMAVNALREHAKNGPVIHLIIPYLPYARQDRVCNRGEALGVRVMCDMINSLNVQSVAIVDPHSDVAPALINNCTTIGLNQLLYPMMRGYAFSEVHLVAPDAGAVKKVSQLAKDVSAAGLITASKVRDIKTGQILETRVDDNVEGLDLLVVDDIFDGGRTFIELGKVLKAKGAANIDLWVTHGLFTKGYDAVKEHFRHVYTTDSYHFNAKEHIRPDGVEDLDITWYHV
jgi:ribose-phosphate pyrophosphokinase